MTKQLLIVLTLVWLNASLQGQTVIQVINFDNTDSPDLNISAVSDFCDGTPGTFGVENGGFVIRDQEGLACCPCAFAGGDNNCGSNNNFASITGVDPIIQFCNISIEAVVFPENGGATMECGRPTGECGLDGGDAMKIDVLLGGQRYELGSFCGNQQTGTFRLENLSAGPADLIAFEIEGGTQDPDEGYVIESITITGFTVPLLPVDIMQPPGTPDTLCAGDDPLVLIAIGADNDRYTWTLNGVTLAETGPTISSGLAQLSDGGIYTATVDDASSPCFNSIATEQINVKDCSVQGPDFTNTFTKRRYCWNNDQLALPTTDDNGLTGTWNVPNNLILNTVAPFTELIFTPDPSSGALPIPVTIVVDIISQFGVFPAAGVDFCEYNDPGLTVDLVQAFNLDVNNIDVINFNGLNLFSESDWRNAPVPNTDGPTTVRVTPFNSGTCPAIEEVTTLNVRRIDRLSDDVAERCQPNLSVIDLTTLIRFSNNPNGVWTDVDGSGLDLSIPTAVDASQLGVGTYRLQYNTDCGSLSEQAILTLDIVAEPSRTVSPSGLCAGDGYSITYNGNVYDETVPTGTEFVSAPSSVCDSMITIDLQFAPSPTRTVTPSDLCEGQPYDFNGFTFSRDTLAEVMVANPVGCDSVITLNLQFGAQPTVTRVETDLCLGTPYVYNGFSYSRDTLAEISVPGLPGECDSLVTLNLVFRPQPTGTRVVPDLCLGTPYVLDGSTYTSDTMVQVIAPGVAGDCDSLITYDLQFRAQPTGTRVVPDLCSGTPYVLNGITYTRDTIVQVTAPGTSGDCDSLITLDLTFQTGPTRTIIENRCENDPFMYNGVVYGDARDTIVDVIVPNPIGCDSIITIELTFMEIPGVFLNPILCEGDTFTYRGNNFTIDNPVGTFDVANPNGPCTDSVIAVAATFLPIDERNINPDLCEDDGFSVTFNGNTYDQNNTTGTEMIPAPNGCDSIINIDLFFKPNVTEFENHLGRVGDGYSVIVGGTTYDENNPSGQEVFAAANGCDSIIEVDLVFLEGVFDSLLTTACIGDGFSLPGLNGDYNEANPSGIDTFTTTDGRDSFFITRITFLNPVINRYTATLTSGIGFDTTFNGMTYDESNPIGRDTIPNGAANSCDSIIIVNLEFVDAFINEFDTTLCQGDTYSRSVGTVSVYDESNPIGVDTFVTSAGIDSFVSTTLNFVGPSTFTFTASRCLGDGFTYPPSTNEFDENNPTGEFTIPGGAANGCDSIVTVILTFRDQIMSDNTQSICSDDVITVGTSTYGLATSLTGIDTLPTPSGCDSVVTTVLTIDSIAIDYCVKDICPDMSTTTLSIFNMQPTLPLTANINGQDYNLTDSVEIIISVDELNLLTVTNATGCMITPPVTINNAPAFTLDIMTSSGTGDSLMLDYNFDGVVNEATWSATDGPICSNCMSINVDTTTANTYTISILDELGCMYDASLSFNDMMVDTMTVDTMTVDTMIVIDPPVITTQSVFYMGNIFTQSSTSFFLQTADPDIDTYDMTIFNRWGNKIFDRTGLTPNDPSTGWNGTSNNNQDVQTGVFIYKVVLNKLNGSTEIGSGDVLYIN